MNPADPLRPPVPTPGELGRLNTPGHAAYMRECRWCRGPLHITPGGVLHCPNCDGLDLVNPRNNNGTEHTP